MLGTWTYQKAERYIYIVYRLDDTNNSREEEDVAAHMCPCGTTIESRTQIVVECEVYKEGRDALEEEMRKLNACDMEEFGRLESGEKTIAILGDK